MMSRIMDLQHILLADWNKEWLPQLMEVICYFTGVYLIGLSLYHVTKLLVPTVLSEYIYDFIKTMLICAYPIGLIIVRTNHGDIGFLIILVPLILLTVFTIPGEATPVTVWVKYLHDQLAFGKVIYKTLIQMMSGFAAYRVGVFVLNLQLHKTLTGFDKSTTLPVKCSSALKVPLYQGFAIEMIGVMYDSWFAAQKISPNLIVDAAIKVTNTGVLVLAGSHLTGMFIHPPKASGLTFGCGQTHYVFHILVYWIGPLIGAWLSARLQRRLRLSWTSDTVKNQDSVDTPEKKTKRKKKH